MDHLGAGGDDLSEVMSAGFAADADPGGEFQVCGEAEFEAGQVADSPPV
jgi:hypothetical protein